MDLITNLKYLAVMSAYMLVIYFLFVRRKNESFLSWLVVSLVSLSYIFNIEKFTQWVAKIIGLWFTDAMGEVILGGILYFVIMVPLLHACNRVFYGEPLFTKDASTMSPAATEKARRAANDSQAGPDSGRVVVYAELPSLWNNEKESLAELSQFSQDAPDIQSVDQLDDMLLDGENIPGIDNEAIFDEIKDMLESGRNEDAAVYLKTLAYYGNNSNVSKAAKKMLDEIS